VTRPTRYLVGLAILAAACSDDAESPMGPTAALSHLGGGVHVTTRADDGPGSFRQAVLNANADPSIGVIRFDRGLDPIRLVQPVTYSGGQALIIRGEGARLDGSGLPPGGSALVAEGGGELTITDLTVAHAPGNGITIKVPEVATGVFKVRLHEVTIRENGLHGILIMTRRSISTIRCRSPRRGRPRVFWWRCPTAASSGTASRSSTRTGSG
jgi:hypothetical protein